MKLSILIVDDEYGLADMVSDMLGDRGHDVALAIDGRLGLASLETRLADVVITDVMMPVMDGPELIRRMRAEPRFAAIPAILMTALPEAVPEGSLHDALLVKPFRMRDLVATIARVTKRDDI
jgi:CheY-like chemotaxis protein